MLSGLDARVRWLTRGSRQQSALLSSFALFLSRMPSSPPSGGPPRALGTKLARAFMYCSAPAAAYGACIRANVETNLNKDVCARPFAELQQCVQAASKGVAK